MRIGELLLACWWTLVSADLQLYHQRHHLLVPPKDSDRITTLFGYSVAFQQLDTGIQRVVVGAPIADDVGRVYACSLTAAAAAAPDATVCGRINVDTFHVNRVHKYKDEKDHSWKSLNHTHNLWLGATIAVTGIDFITCAPRWSKTTSDEKDAYIVFGKCYKIDSSGRSTLMSTPSTEVYCDVCRNKKNLFLNGGLGWSAAGNKDWMMLGAPATCTTGAFFSTNEADSVDALWTGESTFGYDYFPATTCSNERYSRVTLPTMNFGYAMVVGNFVSAKTGDVLAVSSLYGKQGHGEVLLIHSQTSSSIRLRDAHVGSMFGTSLCAVRAHAGVDHEEHEDLLVGAPLYTPDPQQLEQGAVFLYYGGTKLTSAENVEPAVILYGESNKLRGYFGNAIAKIGDVDDDGNEEFAVGAPYEDDGLGAVYVFSVWFEKNEVRYSRQRLSPGGLKGFGQSIAVLPDIDRNGCNELAVGAFDTAAVAVLHCQPIITVHAETNILSLQLWKLPESTRQFPFKSCVRVEYPAGIEVTGGLTVSTNLTDLGGGAKLQPADQQYTVQLNPSGPNPICRTITPERLSNRMEFSMVVTAAGDCFKGPYARTCALLSQRSMLAIKEFVVTHRCPSGVCRPKLSLDLHALDVEIGVEGARFEIGSRDSVNVLLRVSNSQDGAYEWCMDVHVEGDVSSRLPGCEYNKLSGEHNCQIGKGITPLLKGTTRDYSLILYTDQLTSESKNVKISAVVTNFCHEKTRVEKTLALDFYVNPERVSIKWILIEPKQIIDRLNLKKVSDKNTTINHIYKVENEGLTTWTDVRLEVSTDYLPYLQLETPISKDFTCEKVSSHGEKQELIQCEFKKIPPNTFIQVTVPLVIIHNKVERGLDEPVNITTTGKLKHKLFEISHRKVAQGTTLVSSVENANVLKWWHILLACLAALLVLAVIAFVLHKYGFFKRQTKKNLQELKRRSTMRQSQRMSRVGPPPSNSGTPASSTPTQ